jgi:hypothetical protein
LGERLNGIQAVKKIQNNQAVNLYLSRLLAVLRINFNRFILFSANTNQAVRYKPLDSPT